MATDLYDDQKEKEQTNSVDPDWFEKEFGDRMDPSYVKAAKEFDANKRAVNPDELSEAESTAPAAPFADNPEGTESSSSQGSASDEESEGSDQIGPGFNNNDQPPRLASFVLSLANNKRRRRTAALAGGGAGIAGLVIGGFLSLIPLKLEAIMNNLGSRFGASAITALQNMNSKLTSGYMQQTLAHFQQDGCTNTRIDFHCTNIYKGSNPVTRLWQTWSQDRMEKKLADAGIEFTHNPTKNTWTMKVGGQSHDLTPGELSDPNIDMFKSASIKDIRAISKKAFADYSFFKRVWLRFSFGRYLAQKWGVPRCLMVCKVTDPLRDFVHYQKNAVKIYLARNVLGQVSKATSIAMQCVLSESCTGTQYKSDPNCKPGTCELNAEPEDPALDGEVRKTLEQLVAENGYDDLAKVLKIYQDIEKSGGFSGYLIDKVIETVFGVTLSDAAKQAIDKALPIIGWINFGAQVVTTINKAGPKLHKLIYVAHAAAAVSTFALYRTIADEIKTGQDTATEVGSFTSALGPGGHSPTTSTASCSDIQTANPPNTCFDSVPSTDGELGGTATAEASPIYQNLIDNNTSSVGYSSIFSALAPSQTAYAAASSTPTSSSQPITASNYYACNKDTPAPGQICPEEYLGTVPCGPGGTGVECFLKKLTSMPDFKILSRIADVWNGTAGKAFRAIGSIIGVITSPLISVANDACDTWGVRDLPPWSPYCAIRGAVKVAVPRLMRAATDYLIPTVVGINMSGARLFDELAAGADVSYNQASRNTLGGALLAPGQVADNVNQAQQQDEFDFKQQPLMARLFSTSSPYSLVSRLSMDIPFNGGSGLQSSFSSILASPFKALWSGLGAFASTNKVFAAATPQADYFLQPQYGWTASQIDSIGDPLAYWNQNCSDVTNTYVGKFTQGWNNESTTGGNLDPYTGEPTNPSGHNDPCLLINDVAKVSGAYKNSALLSPDDLADSGGSTPSSNDNLYYVGDQLSNNLFSADLNSNLSNTGWTVVGANNIDKQTINGGINAVDTGYSTIANSNTVVVQLGDNDIGVDPATLANQIKGVIEAVRNANSNAKIYWVNMYSSTNSAYTTVNDVIASQAKPLNYTVIDLAKLITSNLNIYKFDASGVLPADRVTEQIISSYIANLIPPPGTISTASQPNVVAQAINPENGTSYPSLIADIMNAFKSITRFTIIYPINSFKSLVAF